MRVVMVALGLWASATPVWAADAKPYMLGVATTGLVAKLLAADNAHVAAGAAILQMDCRPLEQTLRYRTAEAAAAAAAFQRVKDGPRPDEVAIGEANVGVAQARAEEAKDSYDRALSLKEGISITHVQVLEVRRDAHITAAQLNDAEKRLDLLHAGSRIEDIDEAAAKRDAAAASVAETQAELDQCTVRAPVAGVVQWLVTPGQFLSQYSPTPVAKLTPD